MTSARTVSERLEKLIEVSVIGSSSRLPFLAVLSALTFTSIGNATSPANAGVVSWPSPVTSSVTLVPPCL